MSKGARGRAQRLLRALGWVFGGVLLTAIAGVAVYLNTRPALSVWHSVHLSEEFTTGSAIDSFPEYLALEERLFQQLEREVYGAVHPEEQSLFNRYTKGSRADPAQIRPNWNRSFELAPADPTMAVLLLHGLSDSPYSLRDLGAQFYQAGAHVVGLRIPGHGTAPSGLTTTSFEDMAAAVELAAQHMRDVVGDKKIYIVGYSNGGALAVHYATKAAQDPTLAMPSGLILMSPEIGVSPAAKLAAPLSWVQRTFGIQKLAWASIGLEYDPYKYNSFALRADLTAWNATQAVRAQLQALDDIGDMAKMPRILAFQSAVDATVTASVLISELFDNLRGEGHTLVLFDANQFYGAQGLLTGVLDVTTVLSGETRPYGVSVVTNAAPSGFATVMQERPANRGDVSTMPLSIDWPREMYSLAHIALPFSPDDPVYGRRTEAGALGPLLRFADVPLYGERGSFAIPPSGLVRQHSNPFYSVIVDMSLRFAVP